MPLFDARPVNEKRERLKRNIIIAVIAIVIVGGIAGFFLRHYPQTRIVNQFFSALQKQDYERAYAVWMADPEWKQHPQQHEAYPFGSFYLDWGPGGEYGRIQNYDVEAAVTTDEATGVIVGVRINDRAERAFLFVDKRTKELSFSPVRLAY